ncbi:hypothetical protein J4E83_009531 [Alternaria metachromatica]|uniref:uncharacterized protein n=1 Tax=Alternaria metachromatica TaxID=283354 RepID=UPI0020C3C5CA|nr:uncharacterized protein J4E83_009531 [Alternaria metachromatica]KAI4607634.1 hypothetical protein J4E83_009531 [Alternaria metachromatica]
MKTELDDDVELSAKELEPTEELVKVAEVNSVEEVDVKLKLRLEDEFVIGNSVAKPVEVFGPGVLVTGSFGRLDDGVELDVLLGADDGAEGDNVPGIDMELPADDVRKGDEVEPVDGTTEELPTLVGRVDEPKLLDEREVGVDSDCVRLVDDGIAELPILLVRLMNVLEDMSAERVGPEVGLGRDTVKPSLCMDGKTKEPPVVVDVPGRRLAELPDRLVNVVGALEVVGRGKLDVSDNAEPEEDELTDDEVDRPGKNRADEVGPNVEDTTAAPEEGILDTPTEETIGVTSTVLVGSVLNRLGGAILSNHSVVLFTTEK